MFLGLNMSPLDSVRKLGPMANNIFLSHVFVLKPSLETDAKEGSSHFILSLELSVGFGTTDFWVFEYARTWSQLLSCCKHCV